MIRRSLAILATVLYSTAGALQAQLTAADWVNISDSVVKPIVDAGTKIPWPGQTAGVSVDRASGRVYMDVTGIGLYASDDHGEHFARIAADAISGRCEFGYALNADPNGSRIACFMLDGKCGMTLDGGKTWNGFAQVGRNWDFGAVDWTDPAAKSIFAIHHESGGEVYFSSDAGKNWKFLGKHPEFHSVNIFGDHVLVAGRDDGIVRSTDAGATWNRVSDLHPVGRVPVALNGVTYWLAREGIIVTHDDGVTWQVQGTAVNAGWGPVFGSDAKEIILADFKGILHSTDAGTTWQPLAALPPFREMPPKQPGQFLSVAWDAKNHYLYASRMANSTYRLELK
jgi:photosystem II stability/assembly factor-like uncharacterized protein